MKGRETRCDVRGQGESGPGCHSSLMTASLQYLQLSPLVSHAQCLLLGESILFVFTAADAGVFIQTSSAFQRKQTTTTWRVCREPRGSCPRLASFISCCRQLVTFLLSSFLPFTARQTFLPAVCPALIADIFFRFACVSDSFMFTRSCATCACAVSV